MDTNSKNTQIPTDILQAIQSSDIYSKIGVIGNRYNLLLDQVGELEVATRMVMVGKLKSDEFVKTITKNLEISEETARKIAKDINDEIFMTIRESLRKMQDTAEKGEVKQQASSPSVAQAPQPLPQKPLTPLEKVGNFTIEPPRQPSSSPQYNDTNLDKAKVLEHMENPPKPAASFVDHLLANPVSNINEVTSQEISKEGKPVTTTTPQQQANPVRKSGPDPYREAAE